MPCPYSLSVIVFPLCFWASWAEAPMQQCVWGPKKWGLRTVSRTSDFSSTVSCGGGCAPTWALSSLMGLTVNQCAELAPCLAPDTLPQNKGVRCPLSAKTQQASLPHDGSRFVLMLQVSNVLVLRFLFSLQNYWRPQGAFVYVHKHLSIFFPCLNWESLKYWLIY